MAVVVIAGGVGAVVRGAGNDSGPASGRSEIEITGDAGEPEATSGGPFQGDRSGESEATPSGPLERDRQPPAKIPPALEKVWPDAVWRIPDKLPNGREYHPRAFIDDHTILVETWAGHEQANAIYAYDVETRKARKITDIRTSMGKHADGFQVVGDRVYFEAFGDSGASRFWWVPLRGGEPREIRMTETIRGRSDAFAVAGDRLAFSLGANGGVYTVPIRGGAPPRRCRERSGTTSCAGRGWARRASTRRTTSPASSGCSTPRRARRARPSSIRASSTSVAG
ncbi:hypothetical protein ACFSTC_43575 [Nonomuraea ferruginea]